MTTELVQGPAQLVVKTVTSHPSPRPTVKTSKQTRPIHEGGPGIDPNSAGDLGSSGDLK